MITEIKNPRWVTADHKQMFFDVKVTDSETWETFCADPNDQNSSGPQYYQDALDGKYGKIAAHIESTKEELAEQALMEATQELNTRLAPLMTDEAKAEAEVDEEYSAGRKKKIRALLDVKKQKGWPMKVEWPE